MKQGPECSGVCLLLLESRAEMPFSDGNVNMSFHLPFHTSWPTISVEQTISNGCLRYICLGTFMLQAPAAGHAVGNWGLHTVSAALQGAGCEMACLSLGQEPAPLALLARHGRRAGCALGACGLHARHLPAGGARGGGVVGSAAGAGGGGVRVDGLGGGLMCGGCEQNRHRNKHRTTMHASDL